MGAQKPPSDEGGASEGSGGREAFFKFFISPSVGLRRQLPRQREPWGRAIWAAPPTLLKINKASKFACTKKEEAKASSIILSIF